MDRHRIGKFRIGGQFVSSIDLNNAIDSAILSETFQPSGGARTTIMTTPQRRYGGAQAVGETHDNGALAAEYYLGSGASAQSALDLFALLSQTLEDASGGYFYEWRPEGAIRSTFYPIVSVAGDEIAYKWTEWQGTKRLHVKLNLVVAPLAEGAPLDIWDNFYKATDPDLTEWSVLAGPSLDASNYTAGNDSLVATTSLSSVHHLRHTGRGYAANTGMVELRFQPVATLANGMAWGVTWGTSARFLEARVEYNGTNAFLRLYVGIEGSLTQIGTTTLGTLPSIAEENIIRMYLPPSASNDGFGAGVVNIEYWGLPTSIQNRLTLTDFGTPTASVSVTLTSTQTGVIFNQGANNRMGVRWTPISAGVRLWSFKHFPFYVKTPRQPFIHYIQNSQPMMPDISPNSASVAGGFGATLPGTAPGRMDLTTYHVNNGTQNISWGLISWGPAPKPYLGSNFYQSPPAILSASKTYFLNNGTNTTADANAYDGFRTNRTSTAAPHDAIWTMRINDFFPDEFQQEVALEIWGRIYQDQNVVGQVTAVAFMNDYDPTGNFGQTMKVYTDEWGVNGRTLSVSSGGSGAGYQITRLGTVHITRDATRLETTNANTLFQIGLTLKTPTSAGAVGIDWVALVPINERAAGPTSLIDNSSYPQWDSQLLTGSLVGSQKRYNWQLTGFQRYSYSKDQQLGWQSTGLGGATMTPGPEAFRLFVKLSETVPDDPTTKDGGTNQDQQNVLTPPTIHASYVPRYFIVNTDD